MYCWACWEQYEKDEASRNVLQLLKPKPHRHQTLPSTGQKLSGPSGLRLQAPEGFCQDTATTRTVTIHMPQVGLRSLRLEAGLEVVCWGEVSSPLIGDDFFFKSASIVCAKPLLEGIDIHLFAGSFCGWAQAAKWISHANVGVATGQQMFIDTVGNEIPNQFSFQLTSLKKNQHI